MIKNRISQFEQAIMPPVGGGNPSSLFICIANFSNMSTGKEEAKE